MSDNSQTPTPRPHRDTAPRRDRVLADERERGRNQPPCLVRIRADISGV